jgi:hypothetical protein
LATFFLATFFLATFFLAIEWLLATGTQTMELTASAGAVRWKQSTVELLPCRASTEHDSNSARVFKNWAKDCQERSAKIFCFSGAGNGSGPDQLTRGHLPLPDHDLIS